MHPTELHIHKHKKNPHFVFLLTFSVLFVYLYASAPLQIAEQIRRRLAERLCDLHSGAVRLMRLECANAARCTPALALRAWVHACVLFASRIVEAGV